MKRNEILSFGLFALISLASLPSCTMEIEESDEVSIETAEQGVVSASDISSAQLYRPVYKFHGSTKCWPLSFQEISSTASSTERDALKSKCNSSYNSNFVVFANVIHLDGNTTTGTMRIPYFTAFGQQQYDNINWWEYILNPYYSVVRAIANDMASHDEDVESVVADIIGNYFISARYGVHSGAFTRMSHMLTEDSYTHPHVYVGRYAHASYYNTDRYAPSYMDYSNLDEYANFGDDVGSTYSGYGKLVMIDDLCASGTSYTSPDGITYAGTQVEALKAAAGCSGASGMWDNNISDKSIYYNHYGLSGCDSGNTDGGDICNASALGTGTWTTTSGDRFMKGRTVGDADVDEARGSTFSDIDVDSSPSSITLRGGARLDAVSVTYQNGTTRSHGGTGGSPETLSGLGSDPVTSVYMCPNLVSGAWRAGYVKLTTRNGRQIDVGSSTADSDHPCLTVSVSGKILKGFYGRSGAEIDLVGTIWGTE